MKDIAAVYMVAGISSRFGGRIKPLIRVNDNETLIEYSLKQAIAAGITKIIFIVGNKTESAFRTLFKSSYQNIPVYYAMQEFDEDTRERPWGTADALSCAVDLIDCPFILCNGDDIYDKLAFKCLVSHLEGSNDEAVMCYKLINTLPETGNVNRGIIKLKNNYVKDIIEIFNVEKSNLKATNSTVNDLCNVNLFALHPKVSEMIRNEVELFKKKYQGDKKAECLITTEISKLIKFGKIKMKAYQSKERCMGLTNPEDEEIIKKMNLAKFEL